MAQWVIQHDLTSFSERPDVIGSPQARAERDRSFRQIKKGDKVVYYVKNNMDLGIFLVVSDGWIPLKRWSRIRAEPHLGYRINPVYSEICELKLSEFGISSTRGRTAILLEQEQYKRIKEHILGMADPVDHESTLALFAKLHKGMGFTRLLKVRSEYPDVIALDREGQEKRVELEFQSHTFEREHGAELDESDLIVCWEDTLGQAAKKPVLAMKNFLY